jgi:hypothetical protein
MQMVMVTMPYSSNRKVPQTKSSQNFRPLLQCIFNLQRLEHLAPVTVRRGKLIVSCKPDVEERILEYVAGDPGISMQQSAAALAVGRKTVLRMHYK